MMGLARLPQAWAQWREGAWLRRGLPVHDGRQAYRAESTSTAAVGFDKALAGTVLALTLLGLIMVFSATVALSDSPRYGKLTPTFFLVRHAMSLGVALVLLWGTLQVPVSFWERHAGKVFMLAVFLLVVVSIKGIGDIRGNARRWIDFGFITFQPGELAKVAMVVYAASYMARKMDVKERFFKAVWPMAVAAGMVGLLLLRQPDFGTFIVIGTIAMGVLFLGGVNARMFFLIATVMLTVLGLVLAFDDLRRERILAFMDPWNPDYARAKAWQLTNALIGLGLGSFFGQGLGQSVEKLHWLPEAHTDFLLAVLGEELGFVGVAAVVVGFFWITRRIVAIGRQAIALDRVFAGLLAQGVAIWLGFQAFIHMGVNLGVLPTKGLTLPFMSYGGSALMMNAVALGLVLRVDMESRRMMRGTMT
jgi:cell division protein FtsW